MKKLKKGFSLVEMLVVVAIIGVLSTVLYTSYKQYVDKSQKAVIEKEAVDVMQVFETAFIEHKANGRLTTETITVDNAYNFDELVTVSISNPLKTLYQKATGNPLPSNVYLQWNEDETHIMYEHNGYVAYYNIADKKVDEIEKNY